jgi:multiple antibiotic resistance protein
MSLDSGVITAALVLFFVMDPLGNIPLFTSVLSRVSPKRRRVVLTRELLIALFFLLVFLYAGRGLLDLLGLEQDSLRVGGGIVLFVIALRMIFPQARPLFGDTLDGEPLVFPLAVPLIAGPSAFATVLLLVETMPNVARDGLIAVVAAWAASAVILAASPLLLRVIGRRGLAAMERLMGMLLLMIATQMVLEGVGGFLGV